MDSLVTLQATAGQEVTLGFRDSACEVGFPENSRPYVTSISMCVFPARRFEVTTI
jgi:hypothetical protein